MVVACQYGRLMCELFRRHIAEVRSWDCTLLTPFVDGPDEEGSGTGFVEIPDQRQIIRDELQNPRGGINQIDHAEDCTQNQDKGWDT